MQINVSGQDAYCYTGGKPFDAALPAAVFIHGAQNDHSVWSLQSRYFAHHGFGVLAVDLPGHGRSNGPALTTVEAMADWTLALLDATGVREAILIGHSMGSLIALEASLREPKRVRALALAATAYPMKVSPALLEASLNQEQQAIDMVNIWSHSALAHKPSCPGPGFSVIDGSRRLMQRVAARGPKNLFHTDFSACNAYANGERAAAAVACPSLLLLGDRDQMTPPRASAMLSKTIPAARVVTLANCGHQLMAEQPDAALESLYAFASGLATTRTGSS